MSFTFNRVEFVNLRNYDEVLHALSLSAGIPDFVVDGLDVDLVNNTLTNGRGINLGCIFTLGKTGETQSFTPISGNYYIVVQTILDGNSSISNIQVSSTFKGIDDSTTTTKYFTLYQINSTTIVQDYRHINYVKDLYFKDLGNDEFSLVLNGFESQPFNTSVLQNAYTKSESDDRFGNKFLIFDLSTPIGVGQSVDLSSDIPNNSNLYNLGYSRLIAQNTLVTDQPDILLPISNYVSDDIRWNVSSIYRVLSGSTSLTTTAYRIDFLSATSEFKLVNIYSQNTQLISPYVVENPTTYLVNRLIFDNGKGLDV